MPVHIIIRLGHDILSHISDVGNYYEKTLNTSFERKTTPTNNDLEISKQK